MILDSKQIEYEAIDITEPGKEKEKEFMQSNGKVRESLGKHPLPPQIFNEDDFCGVSFIILSLKCDHQPLKPSLFKKKVILLKNLK